MPEKTIIQDDFVANWEPAEKVLPAHLVNLMWMFRERTDAGVVVQTCKHRDTRRYIRLDEHGAAYDRLGQPQELQDAIAGLLA